MPSFDRSDVQRFVSSVKAPDGFNNRLSGAHDKLPQNWQFRQSWIANLSLSRAIKMFFFLARTWY
jgi:hypothetical protein